MPHAKLVPLCAANVSDLMILGAELVELSCYNIPFDLKWSEGMAHYCMSLPNWFCRMAVLNDGTYCGMIIGSANKLLFNPAVMAVEETIFVRADTPFRTSIAKQLLTALAHWAFTTQGANFLRAGETSEICPKAVDAFFRLNGFKRAGTLYKKGSM